MIYVHIYNFLISKNVLYEKQFGFRKSHSTSHAINYSVKYVADNLEQKKHVIGIFLDLSKAFDTICHSKLLVKLQNYGIRGNCFELIKNYLCSRKQITKFNNVKSDTECILFGVPQQWRNVASVAPASPGGAMRRGRQNFELKLFGCKNVPYVGQINVQWWGKKYLGVQKAPGGAKKLQGAPKSSRGRKKPIRKTEK